MMANILVMSLPMKNLKSIQTLNYTRKDIETLAECLLPLTVDVSDC